MCSAWRTAGASMGEGETVGYQLVFWREEVDFDVPPLTVCESLMNERMVDGLVTLPIASIISGLLDALPGAVRESGGGSEWIYWLSEDQRSSVQIDWTDVHVFADCRYLEHDVANRIIELLARFGCPLYDPQVDKRFDSAS